MRGGAAAHRLIRSRPGLADSVYDGHATCERMFAEGAARARAANQANGDAKQRVDHYAGNLVALVHHGCTDSFSQIPAPIPYCDRREALTAVRSSAVHIDVLPTAPQVSSGSVALPCKAHNSLAEDFSELRLPAQHTVGQPAVFLQFVTRLPVPVATFDHACVFMRRMLKWLA